MTFLFLLYGGYSAYVCLDYMKQPSMRELAREDCENYFAGKGENISDMRKNFCETTYLQKDGFLDMHYVLVLDKYNSISLLVILFTYYLNYVIVYMNKKLFNWESFFLNVLEF